MQANLITLYNPAEKGKENLIEEFVVRLKPFERIFKDIQSSKNIVPEQHYLIVGQRGAGKTTLLYRLKYAIEDDSKLSGLIAINLGEEQYHISSLSDLWDSIGEILDDYYSFSGLTSSLVRIEHKDSEEEKFKVILKFLDQRQKKIVLFIDNFGELLKKLEDREIKRFRELLMTDSHLRLIAGTPVTLESVLDYSQPFFEFFKIIELKGLTNSETKSLLVKLAAVNQVTKIIEKIIEEKPERIEILRRLTGGVIRTMVLLFKIFIENEDGSSLKDLQLVLDSLTPLYKHRMDDLPTQQQKIIDVVAKNWDAISVKEITQKTKIPSKIISAQLRQLEKNQIIAKVTTDTKNNLYHLQERFFNIWYLMRYGRRYDKKRVVWLVRFFENWCDQNEIEARVQLHIKNLRADKYDKNAALLIGEAYMACNTVRIETKKKLIETTFKLYPKEFDKVKFNLEDEIVKEAQQLFKSKKIKAALSKLNNLEKFGANSFKAVVRIALEGEDYGLAIRALKWAEKNNLASAHDFYVIGELYEDNIYDYDQSLKYYQKADRNGYHQAKVKIAKLLYEKFEENDKAEKIFLNLIKNEPHNSSYYHDIAHFYGYGKVDYTKAVYYFNKSFELGHDGLTCLGCLYHFEMKHFEKAKEVYLKVGAEGYYYLGLLHAELKEDYRTAVMYLEKAIEHKHHEAYYSIAKIYDRNLDKKILARRYYEKAFKIGDDRAIHPLAHIYSSNPKTHPKAEEFFKLAIENEDNHALACLAKFYFDNDIKKDEAVRLISLAKQRLPDHSFVFEIAANVFFWIGDIEQAILDLKIVLKDIEYVEKEIKDITSLIINLISNKMYYPVLKLFQEEGSYLIDMMKPVYFALMKLMKDDFPNELLKMGPEIDETVNEILEEIAKRTNLLKTRHLN